jgi:hypothetical protein
VILTSPLSGCNWERKHLDNRDDYQRRILEAKGAFLLARLPPYKKCDLSEG